MTVPSDRFAVRRDGWLVAGLTVLVYVVAHRAGLLSPFIVNDDVRQQLFWMACWLDPALYPPDLLNAYAESYVPLGVKAVYFLAAKGLGLDPLACSKLVTGGLLTVLAVALYGLGRALGDRGLGFACAAMAWLMPYFLKNISGGLSRAFAAPLLALFVLAWLRGRAGWMAVVLVATALFIPYMAVLCAGCACLETAVGLLRDRRPGIFPARAWHLGALVLAAGIVWSMNHAHSQAGFGPLATGAALNAPEFSAAGRLDLYPLPNPFLDLIYWPFESIGLFLEGGLAAGIASLAVLLPVLIAGWRRAPWRDYAAKVCPLAYFLAGSLLLYVVARATALLLFVPDRYISYTINLLYALLLAVGLRHGLARLWAGRPVVAGLIVLVAAACGAWRLTDAGLYDYRAQAPLYAAVARLPKDALVAGNPEVLDTVLTFGQRNVLASYELAHPWSVGYWRPCKARLAAQVEAYYAKDPAPVLALVHDFGVTHLVVRESDYAPKALASSPLFEPFDTRIRELAAAPGDFVLRDRTRFPGQEVQPGLFLIDLRAIASRPGF